MDRDQLIDLTRRALKLARDKTTDLTPSEYTVRADSYTSTERLAQDAAMLMASPQLVGYASELPRPGTYCTKTVMGRSILLTRASDGSVRAFRMSACTASHGSCRTAEVPVGSPVRIIRGPTTWRATLSVCPARRDSPKRVRAQRN
jgi:hypothetical protein